MGQDTLAMGVNHPIRVDRFKLLEKGYDAFYNYLPRVIGRYNCYDSVTHRQQRLNNPVEARYFRGFTGWGGPARHLGRVAQVGQDMEGRGPARRVFAALSSIHSDSPGRRQPSTKYSMDQIKKFLSPRTPGQYTPKKPRASPSKV